MSSSRFDRGSTLSNGRWDEEEHPRGKDGRFVDAGGGGVHYTGSRLGDRIAAIAALAGSRQPEPVKKATTKFRIEDTRGFIIGHTRGRPELGKRAGYGSSYRFYTEDAAKRQIEKLRKIYRGRFSVHKYEEWE